jgi:hypothetical protein
MKDFVLDDPSNDRYTYFIGYYGKNYQCQTGLLQVQHHFNDSIQQLHTLIRERLNDVLGEETYSCYHILALASPKPIPCAVAS